MDNQTIDFEGDNITPSTPSEPATGNGNVANNTDSVDLTTGKSDDINSPVNNNNDNTVKEPKTNAEPQHDLEVGSTIKIDGDTEYKVAENGDLVDKDGNVFKKAEEVSEWLEDMEVDGADSNNENVIDIDGLQEALDLVVLDSDGNTIEFTNDAEGVRDYVNAVMQLKTEEIRQAAINKFYNDNPLIKQFYDYVTITGSPRGFGDLPDRRGIQLDKDNEYQLEQVIRIAAHELGNGQLNDNYIKYLKSVGSLYDEAKLQLENLQKHDEQLRAEIQKQAEIKRQQDIQYHVDYSKAVANVISTRQLGKYTLPNTIIKEQNGQKVTLTIDDFIDYVTNPTVIDENGNPTTAYVRDLDNLSYEQALINDLLGAWLLFTGGSYEDLVKMAINEENVRTLSLKSKENRNKHQVKITKPNKSKGSIDDIIF